MGPSSIIFSQFASNSCAKVIIEHVCPTHLWKLHPNCYIAPYSPLAETHTPSATWSLVSELIHHRIRAFTIINQSRSLRWFPARGPLSIRAFERRPSFAKAKSNFLQEGGEKCFYTFEIPCRVPTFHLALEPS